MATMATPEATPTAVEKFESVYRDIIDVLKADRRSYLVAANRFFAKYIIEEPLKRQVYHSSGESAVKLLLDGLHAAIERDPKYLDDVVEVLSEEHPSLRVAFKKMSETAESAASVVTNQPQKSIDDPNKVISLLEEKVQSNPNTFLPANNLKNKFDRLYSHASSSLQHVKLEELNALLELKLTHSPKQFKDNFCPLLKDVRSTPQFFSFLLKHKFCGFLNFDLLSIFTKRFGSESLKQEMARYEASYQSFSKAIKMEDLLHSIVDDPSLFKPFALTGLPTIECRLEESWYSRTYSCFFEVITSVHSWCGLGSMMFSEIEEHCIIVKYVLFSEEDLEFISKDISSPEKKQLLKECGITMTLHTGAEDEIDESLKEISKQGKMLKDTGAGSVVPINRRATSEQNRESLEEISKQGKMLKDTGAGSVMPINRRTSSPQNRVSLIGVGAGAGGTVGSIIGALIGGVVGGTVGAVLGVAAGGGIVGAAIKPEDKSKED
ncbi:PREDICTED: uncharacterized protein LOC105314212 [Amphimedon queenslandica]|uniref:Uncharacterized protein n=1 Tax=Amphimedon queenslandica TaxID=400682 RepID=A0A1X7TXL0_AMPQE|nr:PREDICTED: uncharacterized protein LOC105314212 [Amphimedon queenslandica]|eukprot:XP_011406549.1 PREDICTED: uncharacterized protein LOC105314212 [Amphimedon queenslandica]